MRLRHLVSCGLVLSCSAGSDRVPDRSSEDTVATLQKLGALGVARPGRLALAAQLPAHAAAPLRIGDGELWLEATPLAMRESAVAVVGRAGATVYRDAAPDLDLVYVREAGRVEELRLARTRAAAMYSAWDLRLGPGFVTVQVVDGRVEAVDRRGIVRIASEPAFAVDAGGVRRPLRLELHGHRLEAYLDTAGLALPIAVDPAWVATGAMTTLARTDHSLTRLSSGKVLLVGGSNMSTGERLKTAEIYDPATNTWAATGSMAQPRFEHSATPFGGSTKKVAIVGGSGASTSMSTIEVYDEATGVFGTPVTMPTNTPPYGGGASPTRRNHAAVQLATGDVLAIGGRCDGGSLDSMMLVSAVGAPPANLTGKLTYPTGHPMAVVLADGRVVVAGGTVPTGGSTERVSRYAYLISITGPFAATVTPAPDMPAPRLASVTALIDAGPSKGRALFVGGAIASISSESLSVPSQGGVMFDGTTGTWSTLPLMSRARNFPAGGLLTSGRFLMAGGTGDAVIAGSVNPDAEVLDLVAMKWLPAGKMVEPRGGAATATLVDGSMLLVGGVKEVADGVVSLAAGAERFTLQALGAACAADGQCTSGFCVDGACCDKACAGQCEACDVTGSVGTCKAVAGAPHGTRTKCTVDLGSDPGCASTCNGTDATACRFPDATATCGADGCAAGKETHASTCDGAGKCKDSVKSCGDYVCDAKACKTACTTKADCSNPSHFCEAGKCIPQQASGSACARDEACATGICADGTCCETKCEGQCQACDAPGQAGKCVAIKGKPHGSRKDCDKDATDACKSKACDGTATTSCAATVGPCAGNYSCDDDAKVCKKACATDVDCGSGFECEKATGKCVPRTSKCVGAADVQAADGTKIKCEGVVCQDGRCLDACKTSNDCQNGFACDGAGKCIPTNSAAAPAADSGGCAFGGAPASPAWLALGLFGLLVGARRKRS